MKMRVLGVIPARGGSKGIPRKNLRSLGGAPLIAWTIRTALESNLLTAVCVTSEDAEIIDSAKQYGITNIVCRPDALATDNALAIPTIQHAVREMEKTTGKAFDLVVMLQPTCPLRSVTDLDNAIELLTEHTQSDSVISVVDVGNNHPMKMKVFSDEYHIVDYQTPPSENPPRQSLPAAYIVNGAIYATRYSVLMAQNSFAGAKTIGMLMPDSRSVNIDKEHDFIVAEYYSTVLGLSAPS